MSTGSAAVSKLTLNPSKFLQLEIPLPPLIEQQRVVEHIEALASKIAEARNLRQKAVDGWATLFQSICDSYADKCKKYAEALPLQELVAPERGISYGIVQTGAEFEGGVPTLRAGDLRWFDVRIDPVKQVDPSIESGYQRTRLRGGEVLLRIRGGVGEVALCPNSMIGGNVSREIAVIPLQPSMDPKFAMYMLAARASQERMHRNVRGTSYVGINLKDVRLLPIPVPSLSEQHRIAAELDALLTQVVTAGRLQSEMAEELDALLPAILDRAFKGEI